MHDLVSSVRLWMTFGAVVLLFAFTAPFGTERIAFIPRLGYWLVLHAATWSVALAFSLGGELLFRGRIKSMLIRMLLGSLAAALPIGAIVSLLGWAWFALPLTFSGYLHEVAISIPLCGIFCGLSYMTMSGEPALAEMVQDRRPVGDGESVPGERRAPALLRRLALQNRGALQHISVEDHYSLVRTAAGSELILLRFSDAVREAEPADGMQVHRSHWVARDFVAAFRSEKGRARLVLKDGSSIPVSRSFAPEVRRWLEGLF